MTDAQDWERAWDPLIAVVGTDLSDGTIRWGADAIDAAGIRRYLEPLEAGSAIHYEQDAAREAGYDGIVTPSSAILSFSVPAMWRPGEPPLFDSADRDAQPVRTPLIDTALGPAPRTRGYFAANIDIDFLRPVTVGERVGTRGKLLLGCEPRATKVGRGAFVTVETDLVSDRGDVVARMRPTLYAFDPHETKEA